MFDVTSWIVDKFAPPPHASALRGLTVREAGHILRKQLGYSRSAANRFIHEHKARLELRNARPRAEQ